MARRAIQVRQVRSWSNRHRKTSYPTSGQGGSSSGPTGPNGVPSLLIFAKKEDTNLYLSWISSSTDQDGYRIYISTNGTDYTEKGTTTDLLYTATDLTSGTLYYLYVVAYKGSTESLPSNIISDTTLISPVDVAGILLWLNAETVAGNDGDEITTITSSEGNAYAFDAAATQKPLLKKGVNGINGKNALRFDGINDIMILASVVLTGTSGTIFAILRQPAALKNGSDVIASSDQATAFTKTISFGSANMAGLLVSYQNNAGTADSMHGSIAMAVNKPYRIWWGSTGTAYKMRINNVNDTVGATGGSNNGDWWDDTTGKDNTCFGGAKASTEANFLKADVAEVLVYNSDLGAADIVKLEQYAFNKYSVFTIVGFGDSITAGINASDAAHRWLNLVGTAKGATIQNSGISSTTLQNTVQNTVSTIGGATDNNGLDTYVARVTNYKYDSILILYGLNDLRLNDVAFTPATFQDCYNTLIDNLIASGIYRRNIVIGSPPYMNNYADASGEWSTGSIVKHQQYVNICRQVAIDKGTKYIDVYQWMIDNGKDTLIAVDGIHPNDAGHAQIALAFESVL